MTKEIRWLPTWLDVYEECAVFIAIYVLKILYMI